MTFTNKYISTIILLAWLFHSCSTSEENKKSDSPIKIDNNKFPIEYVGDKILEYNKPIVPPKGGPAHPSDTFNIYRLVNKSSDTIWVSTLKHRQDTSAYFIKDTSVKEISIDRISHRRIDLKAWTFLSDGNCWGNCDFRVSLLPGQSLPFWMGGKKIPDYDSTQFAIHLKIKKGSKTIDSLVFKRLIFKKDRFVDDTNKWKN